MVYTISLKEQRAQLVVKEMNNSTKIVSDTADEEGWVRVAIEISNDFDALCLYHAGMEAKRQLDKEFEAAHASR